MIYYLKGDVLCPVGEGLKIIAHICNNRGGWGKGFVKAISEKWHEPEENYRSLEKYILGEVYFIQTETNIIVANMIAQNGYSTKKRPVAVDYDALEKCLKTLAKKAMELNASIHMPRIGCGLAGGNWDIIEGIINKSFDKSSVYIYDFCKNIIDKVN